MLPPLHCLSLNRCASTGSLFTSPVTPSDCPICLNPLFGCSDTDGDNNDWAECVPEKWVLYRDDNQVKQNVIALTCGHMFHAGCIRPLVQNRATCPICRKSIGPEIMREVQEDASAAPQRDAEAQMHREQKASEAAAASAAAEAAAENDALLRETEEAELVAAISASEEEERARRRVDQQEADDAEMLAAMEASEEAEAITRSLQVQRDAAQQAAEQVRRDANRAQTVEQREAAARAAESRIAQEAAERSAQARANAREEERARARQAYMRRSSDNGYVV